MTSEQQNQTNTSSMKIDNWQFKKENLRIEEEIKFNQTNNDINFKKNKVEQIVKKVHSKFKSSKEGLYKFIEAL